MTREASITKKTSATAAPGRSRFRGVLLVLAIVLLVANLRPALTSMAPLIGQIRMDTSISNGVAGLLTTLPLLAFGLLSLVAPRLAHQVGMERTLLVSLLLLAAGILLRSPLARQVMLFMGLQSLAYYVALTWLPEILQEEEMSAAKAGWMLGLSQAVAIVSMFAAPVIAGRRPSQRGVVVAAVGLSGVGTLGLLIVPTVNVQMFSIALREFAKEVGAGEQRRVLLVVDKAGWHTDG